jgi:protoporphyrinogen oxidase
MTPRGSVVCCEIMSNELRNMSAKSDAELIDACKQGLSRMGYTGWKVLNERVIRLPKSYPVFRPGFEAGLSEIIGELDRLENFRSIGRQGAFNYIGTLDAMDIGYGFARWLQADRKAPWQAERERTNHYPVLD